MTFPTGPVVPATIDRSKRIAKKLHEYFPKHSLSTCQFVTAHLLGHNDWFALDKAIKARASTAPFDEDLAEADYVARRDVQFAILCRELGQVEPDTNYEICAQPDGMKPSVAERIENGGKRFAQRMASELLVELDPTARQSPPKIAYPHILAEFDIAVVERLPSALAQWWSVNIPSQNVVSDALRDYKLDPNSSASLLRLGWYWGTLTMYYAETIDWQMAMGTFYLMADRFSDICIQRSDAFYEAASAEKQKPYAQLERSTAGADLLRLHHLYAAGFFDASPRDDFVRVFLGQPEAFVKHAKSVLNIFQRPGSRRGTWNAR